MDVMKIVALLSALSLPGAAHADVVTDWNAVAEVVAPRFGGPQQQSRVQAMVQIAVHDALNAIEPRYARYTGLGLADPDASPDAAVAAAARQTLLALLAPLPDSPARQAAIAIIENLYNATVGPGPYDAATQAGIDAGAAAAGAIPPCARPTARTCRTCRTRSAPLLASTNPRRTRNSRP